MISKTYSIPNISCGHCTATIERELAPLDGVTKVNAQIEPKQVTVEVNNESILREVEKTLDEIGFPAVAAGLRAAQNGSKQRRLKTCGHNTFYVTKRTHYSYIGHGLRQLR